MACSTNTQSGQDTQETVPYIRPYTANPFYWEYKGKPLVLLGGAWQDNLFNHPEGLAEHLDKLVAVGGNYIRNTMSSRNAANVWAFAKNKDGLFDLDKWNEEYFERLDNLLKLTLERDIIVQVELWDPHDHCKELKLAGWTHHPFNPVNNVTYSVEESGLPTTIDYNAAPEPSPHTFFRTVPELDDNKLVLGYQEKYIDKILSTTFAYPHVLYSINNETGEHQEWGDYWIRHIRNRAEEENMVIHTTDMRRINDITAQDHLFIYQHPERYTFVDISQNNSQLIPTGQLQYDRIQEARKIIAAEGVRPMNNVKIYSREEGKHINGPQRFWRIIFGGCASARFHRPYPLEAGPEDHYSRSFHGLGLHADAQANIRSARMFTNTIDIFNCLPSNHLLTDREENEAYCLAEEGRQYAIYFTDGGEVNIDLSQFRNKESIRWLDINKSEWSNPDKIKAKGPAKITAPDQGPWIVLITK
jgi:hypothetical protein